MKLSTYSCTGDIFSFNDRFYSISKCCEKSIGDSNKRQCFGIIADFLSIFALLVCVLMMDICPRAGIKPDLLVRYPRSMFAL